MPTITLYEILSTVQAFSLSPDGVSPALSEAVLVCDAQILYVSLEKTLDFGGEGGLV